MIKLKPIPKKRAYKKRLPFSTNRLSREEIKEYAKHNVKLACTNQEWSDVKRHLRDYLHEDSEASFEIEQNRIFICIRNDNGRFYFVAYQDGTFDMTTLRIGRNTPRQDYSKTLDGQRGEYKPNTEPGAAFGRPLKPTEKELTIFK